MKSTINTPAPAGVKSTRPVLGLALALVLLSSTVAANEAVNPLLGSWKMKEIHYVYAEKSHVQEQAHIGTFVFSPKRYVILYNPWKEQRVPFKNLSKPESDEILAAFKTIVFNSGRYSYTDATVSTVADIAKVAGFEGGQQFYRYQINGDVLDITMFDETYPDGSKPEWYGKMKVRFVLQRE